MEGLSDEQGYKTIALDDALEIAKKYAVEICKKQRQICVSEYHKNTNPIILDSKTFNKILYAPLATNELEMLEELEV